MKKHIINRPMQVTDLSFDDLYDEISDNWQQKAERLQIRRWRKLRQQLL